MSECRIIENPDWEVPRVLYKYRDWENKYHKEVLDNNVLFLSSPRGFEDELDCNLPQRQYSTIDLYDYFLSYSKEKNKLFCELEHVSFAKKWSKESPLANPMTQSELKDDYYNQFSDIFGVLSLTADPKIERMWDKYSNLSKGFCVGFDSNKIQEVIGSCGSVIYVDKLPLINRLKGDPMTQVMKNIICKENKWSFEKEFRMIKIWEVAPSAFERNIKLPSDSIVEVILGKHMCEDHKKEIIKIVEDKYPTAKIIIR